MDRDKLIIDNHNLIYGYAIENHLDIEEYYGILAIGLVKAAERFDASYGSSFSTFAHKVMKNEVLRDSIKRSKDALCRTISLDGFADDDVPLVEIIPNTNKSTFDVKFPKTLNEEEKELLIYRLCGFSNKDIYDFIGMSPHKIADTMRSIRYKYLHEKENNR